jgi:putative ABC transport system ATP-binding protein
MGPLLIETRGLTRVFHKGGEAITALGGIDLRIREGEFAAIMGPSGAGKSTLLYILGCLDRPTSGHFLFSGREVSGLGDGELSLIRATTIGFIFQTFNLLGQYTVAENVALPFFYHSDGGNNEPGRRHGARVEEAIRSVGLAHRRGHYPSELSGGELQRAAIARALAVEPLLLLADEPTGNLDSTTGKEILAIFKRLNAAGKTILMVTHNREIARSAGRIIRLRDGRLEGGR